MPISNLTIIGKLRDITINAQSVKNTQIIKEEQKYVFKKLTEAKLIFYAEHTDKSYNKEHKKFARVIWSISGPNKESFQL